MMWAKLCLGLATVASLQRVLLHASTWLRTKKEGIRQNDWERPKFLSFLCQATLSTSHWVIWILQRS